MKNQDEIRDFLKGVISSGFRIRQRRPENFYRKSLKLITLSLEGGLIGVTGTLKNNSDRKIQTLIFNKSKNLYGIRRWTLPQAKQWVKSYKDGIKKIRNPEQITAKIRITKMVKSMQNNLLERLPKQIEKILEERNI